MKKVSLLCCFLLVLAWSCNPVEDGHAGDADTNTEAKATPPEDNRRAFSEEDELKILSKRYRSWLKTALEKDNDFCSEQQCSEERQRFEQDEDFEMTCLAGLPDEPEYIVGSLNDDDYPDAVVRVPWTQCDGGNALRHANTQLVFLSQNGDSYIILESPEELGGLGLGRVEKIGNKTIFGNGLDYFYDEDDMIGDPMCCPSLSWEMKFKVENSELVEIWKSEVVREEM